MKDSKLIPIGEFARLCGIKKDTLFHYDEIGLLKPHYIGENGYRYYSADDFFTFDIIASLKECGTPLKEIRSYLENQDTEYFLNVLRDKQKMLELERKKIIKMQKILANTIEITEKALHVKGAEFRIEYCEAEHLLVSERFPEKLDTIIWANMIDQLFDTLEETGLKEEFPLSAIVLKESLLRGKYEEDYVYCKIAKAVRHRSYLRKPAGTYASCYHLGSYETLPESYEKLIRFIAEQGFQIAGNSYEHDMLSYLAVREPEKYVIQISIQAERAGDADKNGIL